MTVTLWGDNICFLGKPLLLLLGDRRTLQSTLPPQSCLDKFLTYKQICDSWKGQLVGKYINKEWQNRRWRYTIITSHSRRTNKCFWEKETDEVGQNLKPSLFGKRKSLKRVKRVFFKRGILCLFHNSKTQLKSRDQDLTPPSHTKIQDSMKKQCLNFRSRWISFFTCTGSAQPLWPAVGRLGSKGCSLPLSPPAPHLQWPDPSHLVEVALFT